MLTKVTLTGADDHTSIQSMGALAQKYPFIEFGILWSDQREGQPRYPGRAWIHELICYQDRFPEAKMQLALHLCGKDAVRYFIDGGTFFSQNNGRLTEIFARVQLNINISTSAFTPADVVQACATRPQQMIITQHNKSNAAIAPAVLDSNHQILFDASGGRGVQMAVLPQPLAGKTCGYAGGLGPLTVAAVVEHLEKPESARDVAYWIDMESMLRDKTDRFSLDYCKVVASEVASVVGKEFAL